jgi:N-acetylmuramoyl-L-alanine amidase
MPAMPSPVYQLLQATGSGNIEELAATGIHASLTAHDAAALLYGAVAAALLIVAAIRVWQVVRLSRGYAITRHNGYRIVHTQLPQAPFTFGKTVFWNDSIDAGSHEGSLIMQHELVHVRQYHTADKLLLQVLTALCWFNPLLWYIGRELKEVHEFLADEQAAPDADAFARMVLTANSKGRFPMVTSHFFSSSIKRRLSMVTQQTPTAHRWLRKALMLPVLAVPLALFSFRVSYAPAVPLPAKGAITLVLDAAHGGKDMGAVSPDGYTEKELTLRICRKIASLAPSYHVGIVMTREGDTYPTLNDRVAMANAQKDALFLSVHVNKAIAGQPPQEGCEIIISEKSTQAAESRKLASAVSSMLTTDGIGTQLRQQGLHVLKANNHPAIAIECGTVESTADMQRLKDDARLEAMCRNILAGIVAYAGTAR